jgi:uncharacterized protein
MHTRIFFVLLLTLALPALQAAEPEPTDASVKQLLEVMQLHKSLNSISAQMDQIMEHAADQAAQGQPLTSNAKQSMERCRSDLHVLIRDDLSWEKMEPNYVEVYKKTFTQTEVNAMIAFYKTPIGQSVVTKLPMAMETSQKETMQTMRPMMERIRQMQQEVAGAMQPSK